MTPNDLSEKALVLEGWSPKIEDISRFQVVLHEKRSFSHHFYPPKNPGVPFNQRPTVTPRNGSSESQWIAGQAAHRWGEGTELGRFRENPVREVVKKGAVIKTLGWLFDIGDDILPKYMGIIS